MIRRVVRIYPVYYLSLVLAIPVYFIQQHMALHWWDIPLTLTGFYAFAGEWGGPFIATSWFLGLIVVMYSIYPALSCAMALPYLESVEHGDEFHLPNWQATSQDTNKFSQ